MKPIRKGTWRYTDDEKLQNRINIAEIEARRTRIEEDNAALLQAKERSENDSRTISSATRQNKEAYAKIRPEVREADQAYRVDKTADPDFDNNQTRQEALIKRNERINKIVEKFEGKWEEANRQTVENMRYMEDWEENDRLVQVQKKLNEELDKAQRVGMR